MERSRIGWADTYTTREHLPRCRLDRAIPQWRAGLRNPLVIDRGVYQSGFQVHIGWATPRMSHLDTGPKYLESNE